VGVLHHKTRRESIRAMASACDTLLVSSLLKERLLPWQQGEGSAWTATGVADSLCDPSRRSSVLSSVLDALQPRRKQIQASLERAIHEAFHPRKSKLEPSKAISGAQSLKHCRVGRLCVDPGERGRYLVAAPDAATLAGSDGIRRVPMGTVVFSESPSSFVELDPTGTSGTTRGGLAAETALALRLWNQEATSDILDHGGSDASARLFRAALAGACCLAASESMIKKPLEAAESIFLWLGRVRINAAAVTVVSESEGILETSKGALALYPTMAASLNHSCRPNCVLRFDGTNVSVIVSSFAGVKEGTELTISYGPVATSMPRKSRQQALRSQYGFDCHCEACRDSSCEDFSWRETATKLDTRAQEEVGKDNWRAAAVAAAAMVQALQQGYDEGDIELARERCKLAGILLRSGSPERAREEWASAAEILQPLVNKNDPDLEEALEMVKRLPAPKQAVAPGQQQPKFKPKTKPKPAARNAETEKATSNLVPSFSSATSPGGIAHALVQLEELLSQASKNPSVKRKRQRAAEAPSHKAPPSVDAATTRISSDTQGVVLGLESLNLTAAEQAKLAAALAETGGCCQLVCSGPRCREGLAILNPNCSTRGLIRHHAARLHCSGASLSRGGDSACRPLEASTARAAVRKAL